MASERRALPLEERSADQAIASLKANFIEAGHKVIALLASAQRGKVDALYCIVRAPWTHCEFPRGAASFKEEEYITRDIIAGLARQTLSGAGDRDRFMDAAVAQVTLNGYPTAHPESKRAHSVEIVAVISNGEAVMRKVAQEALAAVFGTQKPILRPSTPAFLEARALVQPSVQDCLILDVAEEGTDVIIVRDGVPETEVFIPEGIRTILGRTLSGGSAEETRAMLRMMARDECSQNTCIALQAGLAKMEPELAHAFGEHFGKFSTPRRLPTALLLITQPDIAPWLSRFFSRIDFTQFTLTSQPFEVTALSPSHFAPQHGPHRPEYSRELTHPVDASTAPHTQKVGMTPSVADFDIDLALALALINKERSTA